ncbi:hypothetical protein NDU88_001004 [Pleurodeles waltl]|uniref:Reverse transcriptase n=1 Tax=Pleurodeles waltl TaxID=8319 RepID=A0AAV7Q7B9_PLEWA|nr:hypothetical protein NDU88_001004 [Pleurodeles waltl]
MKAVAEWMRNSKLKLNSDKTEVLSLGRLLVADRSGSSPTPTDHARNLGVILDSTLSMTKQVSAVSSSCFNTLRMIYRWIPTDTRRTVIQALVSSKLDYGNALYAGALTKLLKRMQRIQNASAHLILNAPCHSHITPHLRDLHWLPVNKRITFKLLTHAHKALHNTGPAYLNRQLTFYTLSHQLRSADLALATIPRILRATTGCRSFSHFAGKTWNTLPLLLRQTEDLLTFRKHLKTWLFEQ